MSDGPPRIFDRHALTLHRARAQRVGGDKFLVREAAEGLVERLRSIRRTFVNALELDAIGAIDPVLRPLAQTWSTARLDENENFTAKAEAFDLVTSNLTLHSVNDLPGVLVQVRRALRPDGLFLAALFGGETLLELRQSLAAGEIETLGGVSPRVAPFADVRDLGALLQRTGFALPVADVERTVVRYRDVATLVADVRTMGETNALAERRRTPLSRKTWAAAAVHYATHHADGDGRLGATFDIVYLTGWAPHDSQQQPLKPGSAISRLADALNPTDRHGATSKN